ncbi:MAG: 4Fe-4S binding protein [candidate division WOR-3 bacterium]
MILDLLRAILTLGGLGLITGLMLAIAYARLAVRLNEKEGLVRGALPGLNCGVCGFTSCDNYARLVAEGKAQPNLCLIGGPEVINRLSEILEAEIELDEGKIAVVRCKGGKETAIERFRYYGPEDCRFNYLLLGGNKACSYGCLGLGHCVTVCPVKAIRMGPDRLPIIDPKKCTGCGICVQECPRQVIELIPKEQLIYLACKSLDKGKRVKEVCSKGCITCTICVKVCPFEGAISVDPGQPDHKGNIPVIYYDICTSCGICRALCPTDSFVDRVKVRPYAIISLNCDGCGECIKVCKVKAIDGKTGSKHKVIKEKCIGCGQCFKVCPKKAITIAGALGYAKTI